MKASRIRFKHKNMFIILILSYLSFSTRYWRLPHPIQPYGNELFEITSNLNFSTQNSSYSSNSYIGMFLRNEYINVTAINLTNFVSNTTNNIHYRIVTLRQYSAFFSIFVPVIVYILLLSYHITHSIALTTCLNIIFNQSIVESTRYFSSNGLFIFTTILSILLIKYMSQYPIFSPEHTIILVLSFIPVGLSISIFPFSIILFLFYVLLLLQCSLSHYKQTIAQSSIYLVFCLSPLIIGEILRTYANWCKIFTSKNIYYETPELYTDTYDFSTTFSKYILIITVFINFVAERLRFFSKQVIYSVFALLFTDFLQFFGKTSANHRNVLGTVLTFISIALSVNEIFIYHPKAVSFFTTMYCIINIFIFIFNARDVYKYNMY